MSELDATALQTIGHIVTHMKPALGFGDVWFAYSASTFTVRWSFIRDGKRWQDSYCVDDLSLSTARFVAREWVEIIADRLKSKARI